MKRNFYLKHPLMAMHDPRIQNLVSVETFKGVGAYWFIMEKLALLPEPCTTLEYLRPFCRGKNISFAYLKKIILNYQLFIIDEDGYFTPDELNPLRKRAKNDGERVETGNENRYKRLEKAIENKPKKAENHAKNTKNTPKNSKKTSEIDQKCTKNAQKTPKNHAEKRALNSHKSLKACGIEQNAHASNKENIRDIITTATTTKEEEKIAAADIALINVDDCNPTLAVVDVGKAAAVVDVGKTATSAVDVGKTALVGDAIAVREIVTGGDTVPLVVPDAIPTTGKFIPSRPWRELADSLSPDSEWTEIACMKSGYGVLLRQYFREAVEIFKQHIVLYDKGDDLLNMKQVRQYFANFVSAGKPTSTALREKLLKLDAARKTCEINPYRFEKRIDGKRTYMGNLIPDCAPPRPDDTALWNNLTQQWVSIPQRKSS